MIAVKFDIANDQQLLGEILLLQEMQKEFPNGGPFPKYYGDHSINARKYVGIELLDYSVQEYIEEVKGQEYKQRMCDVAVQMLDSLKFLHDFGYLHRDVKPENFRVHQGKVKLIDYGLKFEVPKPGTVQQRATGFKGTLHYASVGCHDGLQQHRRDDLEALGYSLL